MLPIQKLMVFFGIKNLNILIKKSFVNQQQNLKQSKIIIIMSDSFDIVKIIILIIKMTQTNNGTPKRYLTAIKKMLLISVSSVTFPVYLLKLNCIKIETRPMYLFIL